MCVVHPLTSTTIHKHNAYLQMYTTYTFNDRINLTKTIGMKVRWLGFQVAKVK